MELVKENEIANVRAEIQEEELNRRVLVVTDANFNEMLDKMNNPVLAQKELAVKIKAYLDLRMDTEMAENGYYSESTRKWVDSFNKILENIQKALHGDKSVSLHIHKVSHSDIAKKIREI